MPTDRHRKAGLWSSAAGEGEHEPPSPGMVDKDVTHHLRGHRKEVRAILPLGLLLSGKTKVRLIYQCRRLERITVALAPHIAMRDASQFVINQRRESVERGSVSLLPVIQQFR